MEFWRENKKVATENSNLLKGNLVQKANETQRIYTPTYHANVHINREIKYKRLNRMSIEQ